MTDTSAGPAHQPQTGPEPRQFDFWIGEWDVTWGDGQRGRNRVEAILDGAVLLEQFDGSPATPLRGMSVSVHGPQPGHWRQTWVDNQGNYWAFAGGWADGRMTLATADARDGRPVTLRMVWHNITAETLDWNWERSDDGGQTWQVLWQIHYTRRA
jgi:hypothetical protein